MSRRRLHTTWATFACDEFPVVPESLVHANHDQRVHQSRRRRSGTGRRRRRHRRRVRARRLVDAVLRPRGHGGGSRRVEQANGCAPVRSAYVAGDGGGMARPRRRSLRRLDQRCPEVRRVQHLVRRRPDLGADDPHPRRRLDDRRRRAAGATRTLRQRHGERTARADPHRQRPRRRAQSDDRADPARRRQGSLPDGWRGAAVRARVDDDRGHRRPGLPLRAQALV